jgi:hypothetical protein
MLATNSGRVPRLNLDAVRRLLWFLVATTLALGCSANDLRESSIERVSTPVSQVGTKPVAARVSALLRREVTALVTLTTKAGVLVTTPEHPFAVVGKGWVAADKLSRGDRVRDAKGQPIALVDVQRTQSAKTAVYNLEVERTHTYFVGGDALLVHNTCSRGPKTIDDVYAAAAAAKAEIDQIADKIAASFGGRVAKAPLKSRERALEKINADYGGDASRIKDVARNTIVVPQNSLADALAALMAEYPSIRPENVKIVDAAADPLGYSGMNVTIPTKAGIPAEIQINSPEMIYAKEPPAIARAILGDEAYDRLASRGDLPPGGRGHQLYEEWRSLPRDSPRAQEIAAESRAYYDQFRR